MRRSRAAARIAAGPQSVSRLGRRVLALGALVCLHPVPIRAQLSFFESAPGGRGDVVTFFPGRGELRSSQLREIVLLPIDFVGRTTLTASLAGGIRLRTDIPSAGRISLRREQGSLYRYRRDDISAGTRFGFFVVGADGMASSIFELAGTGASGDADPFPGKIAVGAQGQSILIATTPEAGGDLWEIGLGGSAVNRTVDLEPQVFLPNGLSLSATWGVGLTAKGLLRFERVSAAQASAVPFPFPIDWFGPDLVQSADGSTVALICGTSPTHAWVFICRSSDEAFQASATPTALSGAGYLPECKGGPTLALAPDGSRVAFRTEGASRECWTNIVSPGSGRPDRLLTGDESFSYTLNDTGVIAFFSPSSIVLLVGRADQEEIERGDLFRIDGLDGIPKITNLTWTSYDLFPPFDYGRLSTALGVLQVTPSVWLAHEGVYDVGEGDVDDRQLFWIDVARGVRSVFLDRVASLDLVETVSDHVVASVHRSGHDERIDLVMAPAWGGPALVSPLPDGCRLSRPAILGATESFAAVLELEDGEWLGRISAKDASGIRLFDSPRAFGPAQCFSPDGALNVSVELEGQQMILSWSEDEVSVLRLVDRGFVLPGI